MYECIKRGIIYTLISLLESPTISFSSQYNIEVTMESQEMEATSLISNSDSSSNNSYRRVDQKEKCKATNKYVSTGEASRPFLKSSKGTKYVSEIQT